jgi:hypothetical protein
MCSAAGLTIQIDAILDAVKQEEESRPTTPLELGQAALIRCKFKEVFQSTVFFLLTRRHGSMYKWLLKCRRRLERLQVRFLTLRLKPGSLRAPV